MGCASSSSAHPPSGAASRAAHYGAAPRRGDPLNRRVRPVAPWAETTPLAEQQLAMKRSAFWESQTSGRPIVWSNLRLAAEAMLTGDFELASTILEAADIRVPHADLSLAYDAFGVSYAVPQWCYSTPTNVLSDKAFAARQSLSTGRPHIGPPVDTPLTCRLSSAPASATSPATVEQDVKLSVPSTATVREMKTVLHDLLRSGRVDAPADESVPRPNRWAGRGLPPQRQRVFFRGRELNDNSHMQELCVTPGCVLQVRGAA